jgi:hypothetical protein
MSPTTATKSRCITAADVYLLDLAAVVERKEGVDAVANMMGRLELGPYE